MAKAPRKNISQWISDVRWPRKRQGMPERTARHIESRPGVSVKKVAFIFLAAAGVVFVFMFFYFYREQGRIADIVAVNGNKLQAFFPGVDFSAQAPDAAKTLKLIPMLFSGGGELYKDFESFSSLSFRLAEDRTALTDGIKTSLLEGKGGALLSAMDTAGQDIKSLSGLLGSLGKLDPAVRDLLPIKSGDVLTAALELERIGNLISAANSFLKSPGEHHLLVLLANPSELRPGGGFIGSYADLTIKDAALYAYEVHDINDADRLFKANIVPPKPLQRIETRWHIANANWFFDFPTSAKKITTFLSAAAGGQKTYDVVVNLSPKVIADILSVTGPLDVPGMAKPIDKGNLIFEIQNDVQIKQASGASSPKQIIALLLPALIEKLKALDSGQWGAFAGSVSDWLAKKDLTIFARDSALAQLFNASGWDGSVYPTLRDFEGDYLAIADANLGGAKTDLFIDQTVTLESQINIDGTVSDHLVIGRAHRGNTASAWWYRARNTEYIQVFTPAAAQLLNESGVAKISVAPPISYSKSGFAIDSDVALRENTAEKIFAYPEITALRDSEKNIFAFWSVVSRGETATTTLDYIHRLFSQPIQGGHYTFVFDKQPESSGHYRFLLSAPVGFVWQENNLPVYEYESEDIPARVVLELTFKAG
jgi:hypothetical protein